MKTSLTDRRVRMWAGPVGLVLAIVSIWIVAIASPGAAAASGTGLAVSTCHLNAPYKHVIYIQYDNTHLSRDNPNVPSDLEQVPALKNFLTAHGTLSGDNHTPLIAHTAGDIVTALTGLYPDRNGLGVSNSYVQYEPNSGAVPTKFPSAFTYWTDPVSATDPLTEPDHRRSEEHAGAVGSVHPRRLRRRRVLARRHGAREHGAARRGTSPRCSAAARRSCSSRARASRRAQDARARTDFEGIAIHCSQADSVHGSTGLCSPQNGGVADQLPDEPGRLQRLQRPVRRDLRQPGDLEPRLVHARPAQDANGRRARQHQRSRARPSRTSTTTPRRVPVLRQRGEPGYNGAAISSQVIGDASGNSGFVSGFSPTPAQTLGYVASMQESGIPVTFAYIEDAHNNWNPPFQAFGPGEPGYVDQLKQENQAFQAFFERLAADGINDEQHAVRVHRRRGRPLRRAVADEPRLRRRQHSVHLPGGRRRRADGAGQRRAEEGDGRHDSVRRSTSTTRRTSTFDGPAGVDSAARPERPAGAPARAGSRRADADQRR